MRYDRASKNLVKLVFVIPILAGSLSGCFFRAPASNQPKMVGVVTKATGTPSIVRRNENYLIGVESRIYEGDIIQTDNDSRTRIRMVDRSVICLGNDSHVVIHRYDYVPGASAPTARLTFTSGAMRIDAGGFAAARHPDFQIQTPLANITMRGTGFWGGFIPGDKRLDVLLLNGTDINVVNDQGSVTLDRAGLGTTVVAGGTPQVPVEWNATRRSRAIQRTAI